MSEEMNDREKYTIDEMMDQLQSREGLDDQGELVTRSDGTQAVKRRKRKRRSNQESSKVDEKKRKEHLLQASLIVGFLFIVAALAGFAILYANSSSFRKGLVAKAEISSGGKVAIQQFRMNPATANAAGALIEWPEGNALSTLRVGGIVAKIKPQSFRGKFFGGEQIVASRGELLIQAPKAGVATRSREKSGDFKLFQFDRYSISDLKVFFGDEQMVQNSLIGFEASFFPGGLKGKSEIRIQKGMFKMVGWPDLVLDRSYINVKGTDLDVKSLRFKRPAPVNQRKISRGSIEFYGSINPLASGATHTLIAELKKFELSYLLGQDLGPFFTGKVNSHENAEANCLKFSPGSGQTATLNIEVNNSLDSGISLSGFRFLSNLSFALDDSWYDAPFFEDQASGSLFRQGGQVEFGEIDMEQRGRMALKGRIRNGAAGKIEGVFRVGIPEPIIEESPNPKVHAMFGKVVNGYRWVDISISGTGASPVDNFIEIYNAATVEDEAKAMELETKPDSFEDLIFGQ